MGGGQVIEKWYPTVEEGGSKGILVLVTSGKDGSLTGGPKFMKVPILALLFLLACGQAWHQAVPAWAWVCSPS